MPRTSPIPGKRSLKPSSPSRKAWPIICELNSSFSSSMTPIVASEAAMETGEPPKVEICANRACSAMSLRARVRPMGCPLAIPFALVRMSGSTPNCSMPHHLPPVRPQAVCTSSAMNSPPAAFTIGSAIWKYSLGGTMNPPTPMIVSAMKAAISPWVVVSMSGFKSLAQATPQSGYLRSRSQR